LNDVAFQKRLNGNEKNVSKTLRGEAKTHKVNIFKKQALIFGVFCLLLIKNIENISQNPLFVNVKQTPYSVEKSNFPEFIQ